MVVRHVTDEEFESGLRSLLEGVRSPASGFAGPDTVTWTINREIALHAAGPRALLMQFAHPMVAQGVFDHSNFREDLFGRTVRTFSTVYAIVFGDVASATNAARRVHRVHQHVCGTLPWTVGPFAAGTPYHANEPALLSWVWATLIDSSLYAYERFVRPLDPRIREAYYQEGRALSALYGVPHDALPPTWEAFSRWVDLRIHGGDVVVGPAGRQLADVFLSGRTGSRPLAPLFRVLAAGTLPDTLRDAFGLRATAATRASLAVVERALRAFVRSAPPAVRFVPVARAGYRRAAVGRNAG